MTLNIFKEKLDGEYDAVTPSTMLSKGALSDGQNIRRISSAGGWKPRRGCSLMNTNTTEGSRKIESLHYYENPYNLDNYIIKQINKKLLANAKSIGNLTQENSVNLLQENGDPIYWEVGADALEAATELGTDMGTAVGDTPGFSCQVGEFWVYADGSGPPLFWGGSRPFCKSFVVLLAASANTPNDYTTKVIDNKSSTYASLGTAATDKFYICSHEPLKSVTLSLGTTNNNAAVMTVKAWRTSAFTTVTAMSDGTTSGGATLAVDGTVSWTASASDTMRILAGTMGYWYEFSVSEILDAVTITKCQVSFDIHTLSNKWDSVFNTVANVLVYDATNYKQVYGSVSNESEEQTADLSSLDAGGYLYIKTVEPAAAFAIGMVPDKYQGNGAQIDAFDYWNGTAWTTVTPASNVTDLTDDGTNSLAKSGLILINTASSITPQKTAFETGGDYLPGYWYRIGWDAAFDATTEMYLVLYAPMPETLGNYNGCVEFNGDLYLWGDQTYGNRLRYANWAHPDCFVGPYSGYTTPFGDESAIKCAVNTDKYMIVWKNSSTWRMGPDRIPELIASTTGIASPKTALVAETGTEKMRRDEKVKIALWQDTDGVYAYDMQTGILKISPPIDNYFNSEYDNIIPDESINNLQSFFDFNNDEYHLLLPDTELVFGIKTFEFYPPFVRSMPLSCGISIKTPSGRKKTYGGTSAGYLCFLEDHASDRSSAGGLVSVTWWLTTREIGLSIDQMVSIDFNLRRVWIESNVLTGSIGTLTIYQYENGKTAISSTDTIDIYEDPSTKSFLLQPIDMSRQRITSFQLKIYNAQNVKPEIRNLFYEIEAIGLTGK